MTGRFIVTGTDTGIGKTVFAAALAGALGASYWKPVQSGLEEETDSEAVQRLAGISPGRILPEAYRLKTPASPHHSARLDGVAIDPNALRVPETDGPLIIEGAGGLLVPLTDDVVFADLFARWELPVILCARTGLGTINHTLLSLEAMRRRSIDVFGVAFIGPEEPVTQATIEQMGQVRSLGRLPVLDPLSPDALRRAFHHHFDLRVFREAAV